MLAAAVVFGAPQLWGPREWGETDTGLIALLERQLDRIADGDPARRIRILATLATELYFDQAAFRGWRYANQALDEAQRLGRPDEAAALAAAPASRWKPGSARRCGSTGPRISSAG